MSKLTKKDKEQLDILKFRFVRDFVLVKALRPKSTKKGGLIDPAQYEDKPEFGEVISCGELVATVSKGDIIRFGKYASELLRNGGEDYFIIHEEDISARL
jgi:co-chaperonin GroES (HSP10)